MDLAKIGKFISIKRKEKGLTQAKLGDMLGVSDKTVSKWERGVNAPDISVLSRLAECLGIKVDDLLNGECLDNEDNKKTKDHYLKFYYEQNHQRLLKSLFKTVLLISIILIFGFIVRVNNKVNLYKISTSANNYYFNGVIISNKKGNNIIINNLKYQINNNSIKDVFVSNVKVSLFHKSQLLLSQQLENTNTKTKSHKSLSEVLENSYIYFDDTSTKNDVHNYYLVVEYNDESGIAYNEKLNFVFA